MAPELEPAMARLSELVERQAPVLEGPRSLRIDGALFPGAATPELIDTIDNAGPFGQSASAPRFAIPALRVGFTKVVGSDHLKVTFRGEDGSTIEAISFGNANSKLGTELSAHNGRLFHAAGRIEVNEWGGRRRAQLMLEDAALVI